MLTTSYVRFMKHAYRCYSLANGVLDCILYRLWKLYIVINTPPWCYL